MIAQTELIDQYGGAVTRRTAALFVGAGVSIGAGYPSWDQLLRFARRRLGLTGTFSDLALMAQYFESSVPGGRDVLEEEIRDQLPLSALPTRTHSLLAQLPLEEYWTTNFDPLLESALPGAVVVTEDSDLALSELPHVQRILKMHGSATDAAGKIVKRKPPQFVITRDDFDGYPLTHPRLWAQLVANFLTKSFLFLGFSFDDPNIAHVIRLAKLSTKPIYRQHYAVLKRPTRATEMRMHDLRVADLASVGIQVCEIDAYDELERIAAWLVTRTQPAQIFVSGSYDPADALTDTTAALLGSLAADTDLSLVSAGPAGRRVAFSFAEALLATGRYSHTRLVSYFTLAPDADPPYQKRLGTIRHFGETPQEMRANILREVRATVLLGGAKGTLDEAKRSEAAGIPVIPIGATGGTARVWWERMRKSLDKYHYGGTPIDEAEFALLCHPEPNIVAQQALKLVLRAVYLA